MDCVRGWFCAGFYIEEGEIEREKGSGGAKVIIVITIIMKIQVHLLSRFENGGLSLIWGIRNVLIGIWMDELECIL